MKKIMFGIVITFALITFSSCSNSEVKKYQQSETDTLINLTDSNNETQFDTEATEEESTLLKSPTYIDQALIDLLSNSLAHNTQHEALKDIVSDRLLTKEEVAVIELGGFEDYMVELMESDSRYFAYHQVMLVDADNDGIDDIIIYLHSGGSAGFVDLIFYKGDENGTFKETYSSNFGYYTENAFVKYNGKNYFLLTSVDYDRKVRTGFDLYCFEDGVLKESLSIQKEPESYSLSSKKVISDEYNSMADELSEKAQTIYFDFIDSNECMVGSGETELSDDEEVDANVLRKIAQDSVIHILSDWYRSDFDNDGIYEIYSKSVFLPSNNFTY